MPTGAGTCCDGLRTCPPRCVLNGNKIVSDAGDRKPGWRRTIVSNLSLGNGAESTAPEMSSAPHFVKAQPSPACGPKQPVSAGQNESALHGQGNKKWNDPGPKEKFATGIYLEVLRPDRMFRLFPTASAVNRDICLWAGGSAHRSGRAALKPFQGLDGGVRAIDLDAFYRGSSLNAALQSLFRRRPWHAAPFVDRIVIFGPRNRERIRAGGWFTVFTP